MINKLKITILSIVSLVAFAAPVAVTATVAAQSEIDNGLCAGANLDAGSTTGCDVNSAEATQKVNDIIKLVINIFSLVVGVVSVIMIIIGGLKYITSAGDSGNVTSAKNTILYAIIGLVVVALSQFIVRFVLAKVSEQA